MQKSVSLQVKNTYLNIIQIAWPIGISMLIPQLNILTNTLFLGNYLPSSGSAQTADLLAASGVAGIYYLTMVMMDYGLVSGILMLMSRKAGENDRQALGVLMSNGFWLCLLMSLGWMLFSQTFAPWLFEQTLHETAVKEAAISFIRIRVWGLPFIILCQLGNSFFLAISASRFIIIGSLVQTIVNVLFDYLLIFGVGPFPEMGLNGTALASVISEGAYLLSIAFLLHGTSRFKDFRFNYWRKPDLTLTGKMFVKASPLMVQYLLSIGAWEVFYIFVEHLGKTESALSQIYRSVFGMVGLAAWALGATCNSMVSNLLGQQAYHQVIPLIKRIIGVSLGFSVLAGLPILLAPTYFLGWLTSDQVLISAGTQALQIVVLATWILSVSTILFHAVVGTGKTVMNMCFELVAIVFYLVYIYWVIERWRMPLIYAWMSEFVYWFILFIQCFFFFYLGIWKRSSEKII